MDERIKLIRKIEGLSQQKFADKLGIARGNIAAYEVGKNAPSDAVICLICSKFNINEEWLRTGTGEMTKEITSKFSFYLGQIEGGDDEFIKDLIEVYMELDPDSKQALRTISEKMAEKRKNREQN